MAFIDLADIGSRWGPDTLLFLMSTYEINPLPVDVAVADGGMCGLHSWISFSTRTSDLPPEQKGLIRKCNIPEIMSSR